jgi:hypothetical protein
MGMWASQAWPFCTDFVTREEETTEKEKQTERQQKEISSYKYGTCREWAQNNAVVIYCYVMTTNKAVSSTLIMQHQMSREDDN